MIFLLLGILICSILGTLLIQLYSNVVGLDLAATLNSLNAESSLKVRNYVRWTHLISQVFTFTVPALLLSWLFYRSRMWRQLRLIPLPAARPGVGDRRPADPPAVEGKQLYGIRHQDPHSS